MANKFIPTVGMRLGYRDVGTSTAFTPLSGIDKFNGLPGLDGDEFETTREDQIDTTLLPSRTGNTTSGSATIASLADTSDLEVGYFVTGTGIPVNAVIISKTSSTITLNQTATATGTAVTLTLSLPDYMKYFEIGELDGGKLDIDLGGDDVNVTLVNTLVRRHKQYQILFSNGATIVFEGVIKTCMAKPQDKTEVLFNVVIRTYGRPVFTKSGI